MDALIFIDTNILLDFYRIRASDIGLSLLKHIDDNKGKIITGNQIEMEFKKNRQKVILDSISQIKTPDWSGLAPPAFLSTAQPVKVIQKNKKEITKQQKNLKKRMESVLRNPVKSDKVFQTLQRLFKFKSPYNLDRSKKTRYQIRRLAWRRFLLGYPPRKKEDTSMGDAVNWEWILQCANNSGKHVIIVSRDSDYGMSYDEESILNDALAQEFSERVSHKRQIILMDKLTYAFKKASISVTQKEVKQEKELIKSISDKRAGSRQSRIDAVNEAIRQIEKQFGNKKK
jgi:hypothetical protein